MHEFIHDRPIIGHRLFDEPIIGHLKSLPQISWRKEGDLLIQTEMEMRQPPCAKELFFHHMTCHCWRWESWTLIVGRLMDWETIKSWRLTRRELRGMNEIA